MTEALKDTPKNTIEEKNKLYEKAFEIACSNRILLLNDPAIDAISKELKKALGNELVSRIEHLDRNKAIMIVCGDDHLTKGIVDYIWYTHPTKLVSRNAGLCPAYIRLRHRSYSRWTEEQIMSDLFGWHISLKEVYLGTHDYKFKWDYIQFLQDIKTEHLKVFQRLLEISRNYKLGNERMLIVSTDKVDNLPQDLKDQFEIIGLEPDKQARQETPVSTPQTQGKANDKEPKQIRNSGKASFDKVNLTINIDGKPFIFKDTKEYQLFEFLYENQHRRLKKDEIKKELDMGIHAEQRVFNLITKLRKTIKTTSYEIENKKEYDDRGGYLLILKK